MTSAKMPTYDLARAAKTAAEAVPAARKRLSALALMAQHCAGDSLTISLDDFMLLADYYD